MIPRHARAAVRLAALTLLTGIALCLGAPAALAQVAPISVSNVNNPTIAPGATGAVTFSVNTTTPGFYDVRLGTRPADGTFDDATIDSCGSDCLVLIQNQRATVSRNVSVASDATPGEVALRGVIRVNGTDTGTFQVQVAGTAGTPLVSPVIGGVAVLLLLAAGYVVLQRRRARATAPLR